MNQEVAGLPGNSWWVCQDLESDDSHSVVMRAKYETRGAVYRMKSVVRSK